MPPEGDSERSTGDGARVDRGVSGTAATAWEGTFPGIIGSGFNKPSEGDLESPDGPPDFCSRGGKREADELENTSNCH